MPTRRTRQPLQLHSQIVLTAPSGPDPHSPWEKQCISHRGWLTNSHTNGEEVEMRILIGKKLQCFSVNKSNMLVVCNVENFKKY